MTPRTSTKLKKGDKIRLFLCHHIHTILVPCPCYVEGIECDHLGPTQHPKKYLTYFNPQQLPTQIIKINKKNKKNTHKLTILPLQISDWFPQICTKAITQEISNTKNIRGQSDKKCVVTCRAGTPGLTQKGPVWCRPLFQQSSNIPYSTNQPFQSLPRTELVESGV